MAEKFVYVCLDGAPIAVIRVEAHGLSIRAQTGAQVAVDTQGAIVTRGDRQLVFARDDIKGTRKEVPPRPVDPGEWGSVHAHVHD